MSQKYKLNFEDILGESSNKSPTEGETINRTASSPRNLGIILPDGCIRFFNYSYLISGDFNPDNSSITLNFTSVIIRLNGSRLNDLIIDILLHRIQFIECVHDRYIPILDEDQTLVTSVEFQNIER